MSESGWVPPFDGLENCARCGRTHYDGLLWIKFENPVPVRDGEYRFWATCPTNGDPILLFCGPES